MNNEFIQKNLSEPDPIFINNNPDSNSLFGAKKKKNDSKRYEYENT